MVMKKGSVLVDLGNVIIAHWLSNITPENFDQINYNLIPEVPYAFESLRRLNAHYPGGVFVVYNATKIADEKIRRWLAYHDFTKRTGVSLARVVRSKTGRNKAQHMELACRTIGSVHAVVDDRLEVLNHFVGKIPHLFLFRPQTSETELFNSNGNLSRVRIVREWPEVIKTLRVP
jgi:hypothetical protein